MAPTKDELEMENAALKDQLEAAGGGEALAAMQTAVAEALAKVEALTQEIGALKSSGPVGGAPAFHADHAQVKVKNTGTSPWMGSDYGILNAEGRIVSGQGVIPAGGVGIVSKRKALELTTGDGQGYNVPGGRYGVGPFEIVTE